MRITKVYTKTGDDGTTSLAKGERVPKNSPRICVLGSLDETNSAIGVVRSHDVAQQINRILKQIQNRLFHIGGELASPGEKVGLLSERDVQLLEENIDKLNASLPALKEFILPGGSSVAAQLHHARSVCRRAERDLVALHEDEAVNPLFLAYLNRLSDFLFVAARYQNMMDSGEERMWEK